MFVKYFKEKKTSTQDFILGVFFIYVLGVQHKEQDFILGAKDKTLHFLYLSFVFGV